MSGKEMVDSEVLKNLQKLHQLDLILMFKTYMRNFIT